VFLKALARGLELDDEKPMKVHAISECLQQRTDAVGMIPGPNASKPTLYAWRRASGTRVDRDCGIERAKQFLHHNPSSNTFKNAYGFGIQRFGSLAAGEELDVDSERDMLSIAVTRVTDRSYVDGELFIRRYVSESPDVIELVAQTGTSSPELKHKLKLAMRRARVAAEQALSIELNEVSYRSLTREEAEKRFVELKNPWM